MRPLQQQQQPPSHGSRPLHAPQPLPPGPTPGSRKQGMRNTAWSASAASVSASSGGSNTANNTPALSQGGKPPARTVERGVPNIAQFGGTSVALTRLIADWQAEAS